MDPTDDDRLTEAPATPPPLHEDPIIDCEAALEKLETISVEGLQAQGPVWLDYWCHVVSNSVLLRLRTLGRTAIELAKRDESLGAAILARCALETCAMYMYLDEHVTTTTTQEEFKAFGVTLGKLFIGRRDGNPPPDRKAINAVTFIQKMDQRIPRIVEMYDEISEMLHPNWSGTSGMFSQTTGDPASTRFGINPDHEKHVLSSACTVLWGALSFAQVAAVGMPGKIDRMRARARLSGVDGFDPAESRT